MKKLMLIPILFLTACSSDPNANAYLLQSVLQSATQVHQQDQMTEQTEAVMKQRQTAIENME